jgi:hypothetical protein
MTKYNRYLIAFMKAKARKIRQYTNVPYFTKQDEQDLEKWTHAKWVWEVLYDSIAGDNFTEGLFGTTCPFCIKYHMAGDSEYEDCNKCEYGKRHGICGNYTKGNDFGRILRQGFQNSVMLTSDVLTHTFYENTIKSIEKRIK